ncbi:cytidine and dCMP deaminase domain-containing protein 1 isoform X2 [Rhincodon typus]|uniref:cytidine and dCMP deaminase domain-containing protein 1 isoform X2 n=1 Tax=Rhincodon typus TaxID=259920 RepID=UPI00202F3BDF|nr:cytidine and dCMP deaminase domain-containing protein 1 isoform X2 [Rhincodon typus]
MRIMNHVQEPACQNQDGRQERDAQTECNARGLSPRLSKVNFFTLLSLWMELFPNNEQKAIQRRRNGLVVVHNSKIIGLHCSSTELHVGQIAVVKHGSKLKDCDLYFSRKPCSTCLKMVLNAGVNRISYWPGDPEISLIEDYVMDNCNSDAKLDAKAVERLKSNSRSRLCTLLQPLAYNMLQFVEETSKKSTVDCSVPEYGKFRVYCDDSDKVCDEHANDEFQKFARHCMVQARLLAYRTEDQKIGVGAVIWAEGKAWQEAPANSVITSSVRTIRKKRGPTKSLSPQNTLSTEITNTAIIGPIGSTTESASTYESSVLEGMEIMEDTQSPLAKGDLKRPLITPRSESQKEELLNLEINEPAFKRRVVEQQCYLQSLLTSVQMMNETVDRMMMTMSSLNSSLSDVQNLLNQKLAALQTTREEASPQTVSVIENSFTQGLCNIGASHQNSLNAVISDVGSKVQESLQMGFESLGNKIQSTMREGYANLINEHICAHQNLCDKYKRALSTRGLNNSSQEFGTHDGSQLHHPSQLSSGSSLESRNPAIKVQISGDMKI